MKVKNEYVKIKIGNKEITKHNMILNLYLKYLVDAQLGDSGSSGNLSKIGIRLDTPLEVNEDTEIIMSSNNLQLQFIYPKITTEKTPNTLKINYYADDSLGATYNGQYKLLSELEELNGKKIMGIAFGNQLRALTYLDTRDYDLTFDNRSILEVSRYDILSTDGICDGVLEYPFHLAQYQSEEYDESGNRILCELYAIGLGSQKETMQEEYKIGTDITITREDDYSYSFKIDNQGYQYIFFEYQLYINKLLEDKTYEKTYLDQYYVNVVEIDKNGIIKCISKIERG